MCLQDTLVAVGRCSKNCCSRFLDQTPCKITVKGSFVCKLGSSSPATLLKRYY